MWLFPSGVCFNDMHRINPVSPLFLSFSLSILSITVFVQKNKQIYAVATSLYADDTAWSAITREEEDSKQQQEADMGPPLSCSLSFPPPTAPEEDKVRMCRDWHEERAKTKRGWVSRGKNNTGRNHQQFTTRLLWLPVLSHTSVHIQLSC